MNKENIAKIIDWYKKNARLFPWRETSDAYKIWVSEVFLQQTQASRVINFYNKTIQKFPTVHHLAQANWEEFFPYFKGLGFYFRGKNMLKCAREIVKKYNGKFPNDVQKLEKLSGIGEYTAHAICSFSYKQSIPSLDVNLYRVFSRVWNIEKKSEIKKKAFSFYSSGQGDILNHAFMDIGSRFCTAKKVDCKSCPLQKKCAFFHAGKKIEIPKKIMKKRVSADEFSVLVLRDNNKYLLTEKTDEMGKKIWGFFIFGRNMNEQSQKNHRHFLQNISQKKWNIEISVRPPFWEEEIKESSFHSSVARLRFSRCQILSGIFPETKKIKFFTWKEIEDLPMEKIYSDEFLVKLKNMRT